MSDPDFPNECALISCHGHNWNLPDSFFQTAAGMFGTATPSPGAKATAGPIQAAMPDGTVINIAVSFTIPSPVGGP